jgi:phosphoglycolate phosphatase
MKFKTIIFDFDGTIADTLEAIIELFNQFSADFSLPQIGLDDKTELRNLSAKELMAKYKIPTWKFLKLNQKILTELKKDINKLELIPGMKELLVELKQNNFQVGILSSNQEENIQLFLAKHKINSIDFIYSEKNLFGKDKVLKHLLKKYSLDKDEVIYVGDEVRDVEASQKAGIKVMAVTWGFNSADRLKKAKPDYLISSTKDILNQLV